MDEFDLLNRKIENYKILEVIGSGGMGTVYKAFDYQLHRNVAIKFPHANLIKDKTFRERFKREAINQGHLSHPNITTVHRLVEYHDKIGIVIEYIRGSSLDRILRKNKSLTLNDSVYILKRILSGVGYAHAKGFIHRDIKPSNIMLDNEGQIKILDFGISKHLEDQFTITKSAGILGTVFYISPEQVIGGHVTPQSDIYSIGCTFYEMLSGTPPFAVGSEYEIMDAHVRMPHRRLTEIGINVPGSIEQILERALAKDPRNRYLFCEDFIYDLRNVERFSSAINLDRASEEIKPPQKGFSFKSVFVILLIIIFFVIIIAFSFKYIELLMKDNTGSSKNQSELKIESRTNSSLLTYMLTNSTKSENLPA